MRINCQHGAERSAGRRNFLINNSIPFFSGRQRIGVTRTQAINKQLSCRSTHVGTRTSFRTNFGRVQRLRRTVRICSASLVCRALSLLNRNIGKKTVSLASCFIRTSIICHGLRTCVRLRGHCHGIITVLLGGEL